MFKQSLKIASLLLLTIYSLYYVHDTFAFGGLTAGLYLFFNLPLSLALFFLANSFINSDLVWRKTAGWFGLIAAILVLLPPLAQLLVKEIF